MKQYSIIQVMKRLIKKSILEVNQFIIKLYIAVALILN